MLSLIRMSSTQFSGTKSIHVAKLTADYQPQLLCCTSRVICRTKQQQRDQNSMRMLHTAFQFQLISLIDTTNESNDWLLHSLVAFASCFANFAFILRDSLNRFATTYKLLTNGKLKSDRLPNRMPTTIKCYNYSGHFLNLSRLTATK